MSSHLVEQQALNVAYRGLSKNTTVMLSKGFNFCKFIKPYSGWMQGFQVRENDYGQVIIVCMVPIKGVKEDMALKGGLNILLWSM